MVQYDSAYRDLLRQSLALQYSALELELFLKHPILRSYFSLSLVDGSTSKCKKWQGGSHRAARQKVHMKCVNEVWKGQKYELSCCNVFLVATVLPKPS